MPVYARSVLDFPLEGSTATLYVENVSDELYDALRKRARKNRKSIAAEVLELLEQNVPTEREMKAREDFIGVLKKLRQTPPPAPAHSPRRKRCNVRTVRGESSHY